EYSCDPLLVNRIASVLRRISARTPYNPQQIRGVSVASCEVRTWPRNGTEIENRARQESAGETSSRQELPRASVRPFSRDLEPRQRKLPRPPPTFDGTTKRMSLSSEAERPGF